MLTPPVRRANWIHFLALILLVVGSTSLIAEPQDDETPYASDAPPPPPPPNDATSPPPPPPAAPAPRSHRPRRTSYEAQDAQKTRKYFVPDTDRVDAGIFHVGFAAGGNFYIEPRLSQVDGSPTGDYFKDFGFQGGLYFDYDYSALTENVPLGLRGMLGYKWILNSVNVFDFDGMVRYMMRFSDRSTFGIGLGASAAVWYRVNDPAQGATEEVIFLPSLLTGIGFEYDPFMVDIKWLINRIGTNSTITGWELYFGLRL